MTESHHQGLACLPRGIWITDDCQPTTLGGMSRYQHFKVAVYLSADSHAYTYTQPEKRREKFINFCVHFDQNKYLTEKRHKG